MQWSCLSDILWGFASKECLPILKEFLVYRDVVCAVLSDIKFEPHRTYACDIVSKMKLTDYPLSQFQELAGYLFEERVEFSDYSEVKDYFAGKCK